MTPSDFHTLLAAMVGTAAIAAYVFTQWMRLRYEHAQDGRGGGRSAGGETGERVRLLTQENAQLRAEVAAIRDRLATVERIVTDGAFRLDHEIEQLRRAAN
ncbi:hypothetical protein [Sphingomonas morindae]|uniref:Uncharacterized protein n=1 Tax=Sphingomonas morindae TaxID=1541170 RepID=A0ABY4X857_9SPHN|nr:hypothetical protein [Sphingomonas morindae]USI73089.1 hypothetical protein LHA26_01000 [Sphingomonas morindae]